MGLMFVRPKKFGSNSTKSFFTTVSVFRQQWEWDSKRFWLMLSERTQAIINRKYL